MFKRMKDLMQPLSVIFQYASLKGPSPSSIVSLFQGLKTESIDQQTSKESPYGKKTNLQEENLLQQSQDDKLNLSTVLVNKALTPLRKLIPGIPNPDCLINLTDLRTVDDGLYSIQSVNDDEQSKGRCEEQPRPFVWEEWKTKDFPQKSVTNYLTEQSSVKNNQKRIHQELLEPKEINLQLAQIMWDLFKKRDLLIKKMKTEKNYDPRNKYNIEKEKRPTLWEMGSNNLESTQHNDIEHIERHRTTHHEKEKLMKKMNELLNNMMKTRELNLKEFERNKFEEKKRGIIDIKTVIENEEKERRVKVKNLEPANVEIMKLLFKEPAENKTKPEKTSVEEFGKPRVFKIIESDSRGLNDVIAVLKKKYETNYLNMMQEVIRIMEIKKQLAGTRPFQQAKGSKELDQDKEQKTVEKLTETKKTHSGGTNELDSKEEKDKKD